MQIHWWEWVTLMNWSGQSESFQSYSIDIYNLAGRHMLKMDPRAKVWAEAGWHEKMMVNSIIEPLPLCQPANRLDCFMWFPKTNDHLIEITWFIWWYSLAHLKCSKWCCSFKTYSCWLMTINLYRIKINLIHIGQLFPLSEEENWRFKSGNYSLKHLSE